MAKCFTMHTFITTHHAPGLNEQLKLEVLDEPGRGNMHHEYLISTILDGYTFGVVAGAVVLKFQKGPIKEAGVNGISNEILLAIVMHRLQCAQAGEYACQENQDALACITSGLEALHSRTKNRVARGVEGTSEK